MIQRKTKKQVAKQKELTLRKNDERERNIVPNLKT